MGWGRTLGIGLTEGHLWETVVTHSPMGVWVTRSPRGRGERTGLVRRGGRGAAVAWRVRVWALRELKFCSA